jgi:hypothetical protein
MVCPECLASTVSSDGTTAVHSDPADVATAEPNESGRGEDQGGSGQPDQRRCGPLADQEPGHVGKGRQVQHLCAD